MNTSWAVYEYSRYKYLCDVTVGVEIFTFLKMALGIKLLGVLVTDLTIWGPGKLSQSDYIILPAQCVNVAVLGDSSFFNISTNI